MSSSNYRRLYNIAAAVLLAQVAGLWLHNLWDAQQQPLLFDDAYMFARYAANIRHGLGVSWNLDGVPTYGPTSLLWTLVVTVLSYLPIGTWKMLTLGSWLCSIGAVVALAWAVASNARSEFLSKTWRVLPLVALPLAGNLVFSGNAVTGMETMLAALLAAVFVGLTLRWQQGETRPEMVGLVGLLLFMTRPEAAIAVILLPVLLYVLLPSPQLSKRSVTMLLGVFLGGVVLELLLCKLYFGTAFPLSVYMKGGHAYEGYADVWHPELLMMAFLGSCQMYLVALVLLGRKRDWKLIFCCLTPVVAVFTYLETVNQIMGFNSRYYAPYLAFFIVPALLVLDRWIDDASPLKDQWPRNSLLVRGGAAALLMLCFLGLSSQSVLGKIRRLETHTHVEYEPVQLEIAARAPLPKKDWQVITANLTDLLVSPLPKAVTIAATEVGYLGSSAAQANVIDLAGLNDTDIALHGFDMHALMLRKPDILWMPHSSYTYQRGKVLASPELLQNYDFYAGAANYGLAIRKDSPYRTQIDRQMQVFWNAMYPGYNMADYRVRSATWTGRKVTVSEN